MINVAFLSLLSEIFIQNWINLRSDRQTKYRDEPYDYFGNVYCNKHCIILYNKFNHCIVVYRKRE